MRPRRGAGMRKRRHPWGTAAYEVTPMGWSRDITKDRARSGRAPGGSVGPQWVRLARPARAGQVVCGERVW